MSASAPPSSLPVGTNVTINRAAPAPGAGGAGAFALAPTAISALASVGSAYSQAGAARAQADFSDTMHRINTRFATLQGEDVLTRAEKDVVRRRKSTRQLIGRQRAALGAQGVRLDVGTPLEVQEETAAIGAEEVLTIRNNAWREAWGYRVSAITGGAQSQFSSMASRFSAGQTLLTGGISAARDIFGGLRDYRRLRA